MDHSQSITMHYVTPQVIYLHSVLQKLVGEIPDLRKIHADKKGLALAEIEKSRKPDWSYWRELFTVGIEDAIWLTLDLDPRHWRNILRLSRAKGMESTIQADASAADELCQRHNARYGIAESHRKSVGGNLPSKGFTKQVYLDQFGAWAKAKGWNLPNDFPIAEEKPHTLEGRNTGSHPCQEEDSEVYAVELDIALQAWYAIAVSKQGGEGTPKQRIKSWLDASGYPLNDTQIERICTVCNFDKRVGRKKSQ